MKTAVIVCLLVLSGCSAVRLRTQKNYLSDVRAYVEGFAGEISEHDEDIFFVAAPRKTPEGEIIADIYWLNEHAILFVDPTDRNRGVYLGDNSHRRDLATDVASVRPAWTNYVVDVEEARSEMLRCLSGEKIVVRKKKANQALEPTPTSVTSAAEQPPRRP